MVGLCRVVLRFVFNLCFGFFSKKKAKKKVPFLLCSSVTLVTLTCSSNFVPGHVLIVQPINLVFLLLFRQSNF